MTKRNQLETSARITKKTNVRSNVKCEELQIAAQNLSG